MVLKLGDDPDALMVLLYIIHGSTRKVLRNPTVEFLTALAKLVDYYQLHEVVEPYSDVWIANLKAPKSYCPRVLPWLFISWVFQNRENFKNITRILIEECDDEVLTLVEHKDLLIPDRIPGRVVNSCRGVSLMNQ